MSTYQVLARKWRPQRFDDVIGQRGVTQTLRNAIAVGRIAQSFVFAGPRGVGKTTTARILARGLNCEAGPTADPCGECEACIEIAQGRDLDVLEIDAATNTQVQNVRDVIVSGLGTAPARNRYKIFIIDEVHRLSGNAFDALLKSIEEPPPHVIFMMATTEIEKVPATIQSRSQVFELKTIGVTAIADQLRRIADAEAMTVDDAALMLVARAADGSMRDAQSAFDQVIAFAGTTISAEDVGTVLGLVRRDLLVDIANAVAREDGAAAFQLAGRAVESGYELRLVIRELARLTRDLLVIGLDPARLTDPEIAADGEREPLAALAALFSPEDLMRAFDVLTKAEVDIKASMQPRYHLEMALLRWIHLRKLVPLSELIQGLDKQAPPTVRSAAAPTPRIQSVEPKALPPDTRSAPPSSIAAATARAIEALREKARPAAPPPAAPAIAAKPPEPKPLVPPPAPTPAVASSPKTREQKPVVAPPPRAPEPAPPKAADTPAPAPVGPAPITDPAALKSAFLAEVQRVKKFWYGTVIAQAQRIEVEPDRIILAFAPQHKALRAQVEPVRPEIEEIASRLAGHRMAIVSIETAAVASAPDTAPGAKVSSDAPGADRQTQLRQQALADHSVQAMLDVFGTEIKEVEER